MRRRTFILGLTLAACTAAQEAPPNFEPASTVAENLRQHRAMPDPADEVWWTETGEAMAWRNRNLHQVVPTVNVYRDGPVSTLAVRPMAAIADHPVDTPAGATTFDAYLHSEHSTTMGIVILHHGDIVFERYPRMQPHEKPIWWSVTKVLPATLVGILEHRGLVDATQPVERYVPALKGSDFEGVTVRNVLDMASGVDCPDGDYSDRTTCYYQFEASLGDGVRSEKTPDDPYTMLSTLNVGRWAEQGKGFDYSGTNTFVAGWLVEEVTDMPFQDALSREVWTRIGAEADASIYANRYGIPLTSGGMLARPRDMARFGLLFTPSHGKVSSERIVPEEHVDLLLHGGRPELLENARYGGRPPGVRHNVYQWDLVFTNNDIYKGGWAGQGLLVNPERDVVAVWVGYTAADSDPATYPLLPRVRAVLEGVFGGAENADR
ncbi:MAG: serine hydrolase [Acidobacteria bacterium]|nr:serine hydrolase [Acidobacteriota bacterium]